MMMLTTVMDILTEQEQGFEDNELDEESFIPLTCTKCGDETARPERICGACSGEAPRWRLS